MKPLLFGHRGSRGLSPENTLPSFRLGISYGVDGIELDAHLSKDGKLVVMHDDAVDRTTDGHGKISDMTFEQISRLDAGIKSGTQWRGTAVPLLSDVFEEFGSNIKYKVELKHSSKVYPGIEKELLEEIERYSVKDRVQVISFDFDSLKNVREMDGDIELGIIIFGKPGWFVDIARKLNAGWIQAFYGLVFPEDVKIAHENNLKIGVWTPDDEEEIKRYYEMGVDDITSDLPNLLAKIAKSRQKF
ncbi:MAG: glycerophosphodiester phosphodiesterase [Nitrososphaerota archaeon]|nr:glycerophosphodiester phosphodiesterase [Nitrososphaerota archaeon]MDG6929850.1 glycerophosphodiester phosphodiesterase [Nitrososphaerota archaeon]